jgi:hypothetical protein
MSATGARGVEAIDYGEFLVPWKGAFGLRALTCSPVRKGVAICMDVDCEKHDKKGRGVGKHSVSWKASPIEHVVVNAFSVVKPHDHVGCREFEGWTVRELEFACDNTDNLEATTRFMFENEVMAPKLKRYVSSHEGAAQEFERSEEIMEDDMEGAILTCVEAWSGSMNPLMYLWCMRGRMLSMTAKINRLRNTVDIWKSEADKAKNEVASLKWKLKMIRKTGDYK